MPIKVDLIARVIGKKVVPEKGYDPRDLIMHLANVESVDDTAHEAFSGIDVEIGSGEAKRTIYIKLNPAILTNAYQKTFEIPIMLFPNNTCYWYYKDKFYQPKRNELLPNELEEIIYRIKLDDLEESQEIESMRRKISNLMGAVEAKLNKNTRRRIPDDVQIAIFSRDGGKCVKCESSSEIHFDHIIPLSKGGSDTIENLQILCRFCNLQKSNNIGG